MPRMEPLGLIAGEGVFPILVARGARRAGRRVVCAAFSGHAWGELQAECDQFAWVGILRLGRWIHFLKSQGCTQAIMVGRVNKIQLYDRWRYLRYIPDWRTVALFWRIIRRDKRPQAILQALVDELASAGITLIDSTQYTPEHLVAPGVMTRRQPTEAQWRDIRFGYDLCRTISRLDIGQSIAVVDRDVIAVEAVEGTNAMIERAGQLCRSGGWTLIKVSNTNQDMRVDVPTVGTTTIEKLASARAGCLVLEPGKTIMLEKPKVLELADRLKIAVVGYAGEPSTTGGLTSLTTGEVV
jgi:UDP-2,3-diacylglucosamine hydrolase